MIAFAFCNAHAEITPLSQQMARSVMQNWPDGHYSTDQGEWKWDYRLGTVLNGMDAVWHNTADPAYYDYIKTAVDQFVADDGSIRTYNAKDYSLDSVLLGQQLLMLYGVTQDREVLQSGEADSRTISDAATQRIRRILASRPDAQPDVAGRALHGRAVLRRVCFHVSGAE